MKWSSKKLEFCDETSLSFCRCLEKFDQKFKGRSTGTITTKPGRMKLIEIEQQVGGTIHDPCACNETFNVRLGLTSKKLSSTLSFPNFSNVISKTSKKISDRNYDTNIDNLESQCRIKWVTLDVEQDVVRKLFSRSMQRLEQYVVDCCPLCKNGSRYHFLLFLLLQFFQQTSQMAHS